MFNDQVLKQTQPAARQPYVTPQLTTYGLIRDITAGGAGSVAEGGAMVGMNKHT